MPTSLTIEGKRLDREKDIVQALNQHFVSVGTKLADQIAQNPNDDPLKHIVYEKSSMCFSLVTKIMFLKPFNSKKMARHQGLITSQ